MIEVDSYAMDDTGPRFGQEITAEEDMVEDTELNLSDNESNDAPMNAFSPAFSRNEFMLKYMEKLGQSNESCSPCKFSLNKSKTSKSLKLNSREESIQSTKVLEYEACGGHQLSKLEPKALKF